MAGPNDRPEVERHALAPLLPALRALLGALARSDASEVTVRYRDLNVAIRQRPAPAAGPPRAALEAARQALTVDAPLTGVFYRRPAPNHAEYVPEGAHVEVGQVIGLIEAMKVFNEIRADKAGRAIAYLAADGQLVHPGEALLELTPDDSATAGSAAAQP